MRVTSNGEGVSTDLIDEIAPLQLDISADMFIDCPCKFFIELVGDAGHQDCPERDDAWNSDEERLYSVPEPRIKGALEVDDSIMNLVCLIRSVYKDTNVVQAEADNLNRVFQPQRIVDQHQLIHEAENKER